MSEEPETETGVDASGEAIGGASTAVEKVPDEPDYGEHPAIIKLDFAGEWTASRMSTFLATVQYAYCSVLEISQPTDGETTGEGEIQSRLRQIYAAESHTRRPMFQIDREYPIWRRAHLLDNARPDELLGLPAMAFASPGWAHIVGTLNPLRLIGEMINWFAFFQDNKEQRRLANERTALENEGVSIGNDIKRSTRAKEWAEARAHNDRVAFGRLQLVEKQADLLSQAGYTRSQVEAYLEQELLHPLRELQDYVRENQLRFDNSAVVYPASIAPLPRFPPTREAPRNSEPSALGASRPPA